MLISEYEDTEAKFDKMNANEDTGIRIKINKEYRVVTHMENAH